MGLRLMFFRSEIEDQSSEFGVRSSEFVDRSSGIVVRRSETQYGFEFVVGLFPWDLLAWVWLLILFMLKDFRAFDLSKQFYHRCKYLRMPIHLKDQLMRASASIALNLAESSGRESEREKLRYFTIALGSLRESQAILELEKIDDAELKDITDQLGRILFHLCKKAETPTSPN
jgi:four helix bundle protein